MTKKKPSEDRMKRLVKSKLTPINAKKRSIFGCMKNTVKFISDVTKPIGEKWDAAH